MHTAQFKASAPLTSSKVDKELGIIRDVALMSVGVAHGSINGKPMATEVTLESLKAFYALLNGAPKKSHMMHGDDHAPTNAIGIFSGFYLDLKSEPATLRAAQFEAFKAFRENSKEEFETMFELAEKSPSDMALSADFDLNLEEREGGQPPVVMPTSIRSFDFVNEGAATPGLFEKNDIDEAAKKEQQRLKEVETQSQQSSKFNFLTMTKAVFAHFAANSKALPHIAKFAAEADEKATDQDIISKVELALSEDEQAAVIAERDALKAEVEALKAKVSELSPKAENEAALSKKVTDLETQVANYQKASRGRYQGAAPVNLGKGEGKEPVTITRAAFNAMPHDQRNAHMSAGGKITD